MKSIIMFGIIGVLAFFLLGFMHEQAHKTINEYYGVESHIDLINYFPDFATIIDKGECKDNCILAQSNVEAIGYQLTPFFILIFFGLMIIISELSYSNYLKEQEFKRKYE